MNRKIATAVVSLALSALTAVAAPLATYEGKISDKTPGWKFTPSKADEKGMSYTEAEGYYPDRGGTLFSEQISLNKKEEKGAWYRLTFDAETKEHTYWGVNFYDKDGKIFIADHNDLVFTGGKQNFERYFYASDKAAKVNIFFIAKKGIEVWDVKLEESTAADAAKSCDSFYEKMPKLDKFFPPMKASEMLPKTSAALKNGTPFRVIMLGDSIINDTYNSNFQSLVAKAYPNNKFEYVASVYGCGGGNLYHDREKFKEFVTDLKPDLLIIGGVSNCFNAPAAQSVTNLEQAINMAKELKCEILVMTPGAAWDTRTYDLKNPSVPLPAQVFDPKENLRIRYMNNWNMPRDLLKVSTEAYLHLDFANEVRAVAKHTGVPLLEVTVPAYSYIFASEKPWGFFARDAVHSNVYGKQINGRILANFLVK